MKMQFLPDVPILDPDFPDNNIDLLGFSEFVKLLQASIYSTKPPFTYGVLGDWGTGKTSTLRMLQKRLNDNITKRPFVPIWFNAWQYENDANIVYPLLHAIKREHDKEMGGFDKGFKAGFARVVATSALALTDVGLRVATKQLTGEALKLGDLTKHFEEVEKHADDLASVLGAWTDQVTDLKQAFEDLLNIFAEDIAYAKPEIGDGGKVRFVILIDDLDRCLPETTIAILESIKNYLAVENAIFILGLNPDVVYKGIQLKYSGLDINGREYLEKILNYTFYVPEPKPELVAKFAENRIKELVPEAKDSAKYTDYFKDLKRVLQDCNFNNPRKIKRILNRYLLFMNLYESKLADYDDMKNIVRLLIIAEYFPDLFQLFLNDTEEIRQATKFGEKDFNISEFEKRFGLKISGIYPQLARMSNLFDLTETRDKRKTSLWKQAQDVFSITRLI
jgi:predicted KAP-like P-loop ATPase